MQPKNKATPLDTFFQSVDTSFAHSLPPVDNDTTSSVSDVVTLEPQVSVSSQPSDDEVSDSKTSRKSVIEFIKSELATLASAFLKFVSNNDFYCYSEV